MEGYVSDRGVGLGIGEEFINPHSASLSTSNRLQFSVWKRGEEKNEVTPYYSLIAETKPGGASLHECPDTLKLRIEGAKDEATVLAEINWEGFRRVVTLDKRGGAKGMVNGER